MRPRAAAPRRCGRPAQFRHSAGLYPRAERRC